MSFPCHDFWLAGYQWNFKKGWKSEWEELHFQWWRVNLHQLCHTLCTTQTYQCTTIQMLWTSPVTSAIIISVEIWRDRAMNMLSGQGQLLFVQVRMLKIFPFIICFDSLWKSVSLEVRVLIRKTSHELWPMNLFVLLTLV